MDKKLKKYFLISMIFSVFILALIIGLAIVEKNTQLIISGHELPFLKYEFKDSTIKFIQIHFMGQNFTFNF